METTMNAPKAMRVLVVVRANTKEVRRTDDGSYYKLEVESIASQDVTLKTLNKVTEETVESDWGLFNKISLLRINDVFYDLWLKDKCVPNNVLLVTVEQHVKGVTEYIDKDGVIKKHAEDGIDIKLSRQAIELDLARISKTADIKSDIPILLRGIERANARMRSIF